MSYNILKKNVRFSGPVSGTIEGMVDTSTDQTIEGQKTFTHTVTSSADVMLSGSGKVSASFFYGDGSNLSGLPSDVGGSNTQVQFNDDGVHGGSADFTFATGSSTLSVNTGSVEVLSASNYVSASAYYGDGSNLTNVGAESIEASKIIGQISGSQISASIGLTTVGDNLAVRLKPNGGIVDDSGLIMEFGDLSTYSLALSDNFIIGTSGSGVGNVSITFQKLGAFLRTDAGNINQGTLDNARLPANISVTSVTASTHISASTFHGDGSSLTGITATATPAGSNTEIQFNDDGATGASADFTFATGSSTLTVSTGSVEALTASNYVSASTYYGDGSNLTNITATASPAGSNTEVQFNADGITGASADFTFVTSSNSLFVSGNLSASHIVPNADEQYDIGQDELRYENLYAKFLNGGITFSAVNDEGATINKGDVVYIKGVSGQTPTVGLAACDDPAKMPAFGLVGDGSITNGSTGRIVTFGRLNGFDTSAFSEGDTLYVQTGSGGTSGSLTNTAPTGSGNLLQNIGKVTYSDASGQIRVGGAGRTNATPNLDEGYIFIGNSTDQSVQDNTIYVSSSVSRVGINNTNPQHTLSVDGEISASSNLEVGGHITGSGDLVLFNSGSIITDGNLRLGGDSAISFDDGAGQLSSISQGGTNQLTIEAHNRLTIKADEYVIFHDSANNERLVVDYRTTDPTPIQIIRTDLPISSSDFVSASSYATAEGTVITDEGNFQGNNASFNEITASSVISSSAEISASSFHGDGSQLTNLPDTSPAGANTQIQFNDDGVFGAVSDFTFTTSSNSLYVSGAVTGSGLRVTGKSVLTDDVTITSGKRIYLDGTGIAINQGPFIYGSANTMYLDGDDNMYLYHDSRMSIFHGSNRIVDINGGAIAIDTTMSSSNYISASVFVGNLQSDNINISASSNIGITGSTGLVAEFDSGNSYLFKARKLYYKEITFQLASSLSGGDSVWLPMGGTLNDITSQQYYTKFIAPFDGEIVKVMMRADLAAGLSDYTLGFYKSSNGTEHPTTSVESGSINLDGIANTTRTLNFSSATFSSGDVLGFELTLPGTWSPASSIGVNATIVIAYDELS